jgi:hypothetical protein
VIRKEQIDALVQQEFKAGPEDGQARLMGAISSRPAPGMQQLLRLSGNSLFLTALSLMMQNAEIRKAFEA